MAGKLDALTCGDGHAELRFDKNNPIETDRARRAVMALLKTGCILFVDIGGKLERVVGFDATHDCYLITDVPEVTDNAQDSNEPQATNPPKPDAVDTKPKKGRKTRKVPAQDVDATAVPMRAGG